ncbi:SHOCT domain-containing protein, partial [Streptomyces bobili]
GRGTGPGHDWWPRGAPGRAARARGRGPSPGWAPRAPRRDPADVAERIRHLGDLHSAGLVTDEEFSAKKAELLAEL